MRAVTRIASVILPGCRSIALSHSFRRCAVPAVCTHTPALASDCTAYLPQLSAARTMSSEAKVDLSHHKVKLFEYKAAPLVIKEKVCLLLYRSLSAFTHVGIASLLLIPS